MDWAILIAASIAAGGSLVGAWLSYRSNRNTQQAEHEHADDARLYDRRMDLYSRLIKILRGHERELKRQGPADNDDPEAVRAWMVDFFLDLVGDSTVRVTEATATLGQLRLIASGEVITAAEESLRQLQYVQSAWMALALEFTKERGEQDLAAVFESKIAPAQEALTASIDGLEVAVRNELRVG